MLRDDILSLRPTPPKPWRHLQSGVEAYISEMDAAAYDEWLAAVMAGKNSPAEVSRSKLALIRLCVCDAAGVRVFSESDEAAMGAMAASVVNDLYRACADANGIGASLEDDAKN